MRQYIDALNETALPEAAGDSFNYDLKAKYAEFNAKYFNGELPECKVRFGVLKGKGGVCRCKLKPPATPQPSPRVLKARGLSKHHGYTLVPGSLSITISSAYERNPRDIDAILLHEMIHAWFYYKEDWGVHHDGPFLRMREELSRKSGIDIPLTDDTKDLAVSAEVGTKRIGVLIYERGDGTVNFGLVSAKAMETVKTRALEKVSWIEKTKRTPMLHVTMKIVSSPFWTRKALSGIPVSRDRIRAIYKFAPGEQEQALAEFKTGEEVFEFFGDKAAAEAAKADPRNAANYD